VVAMSKNPLAIAFTEFAASWLRKSLAADLAKLSAPKSSAEKKK
jgi:hypothetical protein